MSGWMGVETAKKNKFNYPEVVGNHFLYRHSVNDHNNKRHSPISLEGLWATKYWPNRVFSFLLSVTKVNVNLTATYFGGQEPTGQINFCKKLVKTLIFNTHYNEDDDKTPDKKRKQREYGHCLITLTKSKTFSGTRIVAANSEYPQHKCNAWKKGYIPIAYATQESTSVQNVSVIILHIPKTSFQHQAEFSCSKPEKMACN